MKPPEAAVDVFRARLPLAQRYVEHLSTTGVEWGLIGPREVPRLWDRHVLNCAVVEELIPRDATVVDVGSGAGLPGLPLAIAREDLRVILVEPLERRCRWLSEVVADLELPVEVVRGRAEEVVGTVSGDVVTARAVAPLDKLARWLVPLRRPGGVVLAMKGRSAAEEVEKARQVLRRLQISDVQVLSCGADVLADSTTVVRLL